MTLSELPKDTYPDLKVSLLRFKLIGRVRVVWLLMMCCLLACPLSAAQFGNFYYTASSGEITITGYRDYHFTPTAVTIPETIEGLPVTGLSPETFFVLGGQITSLSLPSGMREIDGKVFQWCDFLTNLSVSAENPHFKSVGGVLFDKSGTVLVRYPTGRTGSYVVPAAVTGLGRAAFSYCSSLSGISFPPGLVSVGADAFFGSEALTSVTIPAGVTTIGTRAFGYLLNLIGITVDPANQDFSSSGGVLFNKNQTTLVQYPGGRGGSYVIPPTVTVIGESAFTNCHQLSGITIPQGVTSIGTYAFWNCYSINTIEIPAATVFIGDYPFTAIWNLLSITVDPSNTAYASLDGVLFNKSLTTLMQYPPARPGEYQIPTSVVQITGNAFRGAKALTGITFPAGMASIGNSAFDSCEKLGSATFLGDAPAMGSAVFFGTKAGFTIYYNSTRTGFTSPLWNGYAAEVMRVEPVLQVQGVVVGAGGEVTLSWPAPEGVTDPGMLSDIVQRSGIPGEWVTIPAPGLSISGGMVTFTDNAPLPGKGFYRVGRW